MEPVQPSPWDHEQTPPCSSSPQLGPGSCQGGGRLWGNGATLARVLTAAQAPLLGRGPGRRQEGLQSRGWLLGMRGLSRAALQEMRPESQVAKSRLRPAVRIRRRRLRPGLCRSAGPSPPCTR